MQVELNINDEVRTFDVELTPSEKNDFSAKRKLKNSGKTVRVLHGKFGVFTLSQFPKLNPIDDLIFLQKLNNHDNSCKLKLNENWYDVELDEDSFSPTFQINEFGEIKALKLQTTTYIDSLNIGTSVNPPQLVPDELEIISSGQVDNSGDEITFTLNIKRQGNLFPVTKDTVVNLRKLSGNGTFNTETVTFLEGESTVQISKSIVYNDLTDDILLVLEASQISGDYLPNERHNVTLIGKHQVQTNFYYGASIATGVPSLTIDLSSKLIFREEQSEVITLDAERPFIIYDASYGLPAIIDFLSEINITEDLDLYLVEIEFKLYVMITTTLVLNGTVRWRLSFSDGTPSYPLVTEIDTNYDPYPPKFPIP